MITAATRFLDQEQIPYRKVMHVNRVLTVDEVVCETGLHPDQVVKAMVLESREGELVVALLRGSRRLDVRAVSEITGLKLKIMRREKVEAAMGFPLGAVSPLGLLGLVSRVVADEGIFEHEMVNVSSGDPMMSLEIRSSALGQLCGESRARIAR
jgi:prolyl-tRNA editing enzyme YbaK/EbsC (Cys-tRNA(Pro) deacylase)